ncbi:MULTISPECIES: hypothetical protein [Methylobacteriaceae]|uniref:Uncharacterized protein n=2 Tax=Methylobacteriaceae TaxID=119045 RepID=A0AA37HSD6_9HYPH|nr:MULTISPECIES: hypothetical protein [Methylobacteriaceae]MDQ0520069.1 K+/H+ antiporter YhaU regulatory subunit KhtT [Methylobacterium gregans]BAU90645.1 hypothetical protein MPPM_2040 [Methylorubrum populi]GJD81222.1 hypothetical protein NBEOAGPD_4468 [Methylobacterium gregans]GLS52470.1 hypothetical protein GCM10007886_06530 [Methylobacterium gregans]
MTHHARNFGIEAAGTVGLGLALGHVALQDGMREIRRQQRASRNSVVALADRLDEARADQAAALNRAARAEAELAHARQQIRDLEILLDRQTRLVEGFREICGV